MVKRIIKLPHHKKAVEPEPAKTEEPVPPSGRIVGIDFAEAMTDQNGVVLVGVKHDGTILVGPEHRPIQRLSTTELEALKEALEIVDTPDEADPRYHRIFRSENTVGVPDRSIPLNPPAPAGVDPLDWNTFSRFVREKFNELVYCEKPTAYDMNFRLSKISQSYTAHIEGRDLVINFSNMPLKWRYMNPVMDRGAINHFMPVVHKRSDFTYECWIVEN